MKAVSRESHDAPAEPSTETETSEEIPEAVRTVLDAHAPGAASREEAPREEVSPGAAFGNLAIAQIVDVRGSEIDIRLGGRIVTAKAGPVIHAAVLKTASDTGEPVLVERGPDGALVVVGALRTRPTPGVDETPDVTIEADRIHLRGRQEIVLATSGIASLALRAAGEIESYADRIVSRAEGIHKIVGRMLKLN